MKKYISIIPILVLQFSSYNIDSQIFNQPLSGLELDEKKGYVFENLEKKFEEQLLLSQTIYKSTNYGLINYDTLKQSGYHHSKTLIYYTLGLGCGKFKKKADLSRELELSIIYKKSVVSIRLSGISEFLIFETYSPLEKVYDLGLLYGRKMICGKSMIIFSSGISYNNSIIRGKFKYYSGGFFSVGNYERVTYKNIGIPMEINILFGKKRNSCFGLQAFTNINTKYPFVGLNICFRVGKIQD